MGSFLCFTIVLDADLLLFVPNEDGHRRARAEGDMDSPLAPVTCALVSGASKAGIKSKSGSNSFQEK
jgi:hypothetical protein